MREPAGFSAFDGDYLVQNECLLPSQVETHATKTGEQRLALAVIGDAIEVALGMRSVRGYAGEGFQAEWLRVRRRDPATRRKTLDKWRRRKLDAGRQEALHFLASNLGAFWFAVARVEHVAIREWATRELQGGLAMTRRWRVA